MKETQTITPDQTELHAVKPVRKEKTLVARLRLHPGQKVWELDRATNEIAEAKYESSRIDFEKAAKGAVGQINHQLMIRENCLYCTATNKPTADKKFQKMLGLHPTKLVGRNGKAKYVPAGVVQRAIQELAKQHGHGQ